METHFVVADADAIAVMQCDGLDSIAIDEGALMHREVANRIVRARPFDYRVARLDSRVAEQPDRILLGPANRRGCAFDSILSSAQASRFDREPSRFRQFLHQSDEETDRKADRAQREKAREQSRMADRADQVEQQSANEAAD